MAANRYFHLRGGREAGPFTAAELQALARRGGISPDDLIRPDGAQRSYPARNVVGLFSNAPSGNAAATSPPVKTPAASPMRHAVISHAPQVAAAASQATKGTTSDASPNRSPLTALLAALVDLQREELTRQVVRGERTAADAERRTAELAALLRAVEAQFLPATKLSGGFSSPVGAASIAEEGGARVQQTAAATSPIFVPSAPPPTDTGLGTALGIGAAALLAGGAGMALGRAMAPSSSPAPQPPAPPREASSPPPGIAQVSRALWQMRPNGVADHSPTFDAPHESPHTDAPQDLSHHDLPHDADIPTADPIEDAEIIEAQPPEFDSSPSSGLSWDDPVPEAETFAATPPDDIPMAEPMEQPSGGFFDGLFGGSEPAESTAVEASGGEDGGWFGMGGDDTVVETDGGLFGGDAVDTGGLDTGGLDAGVDAGDLDVGGLDFSDGGGFEF